MTAMVTIRTIPETLVDLANGELRLSGSGLRLETDKWQLCLPACSRIEDVFR